jgi:peroxiredoxin
MSAMVLEPSLQPGDRAPDFTLPAIEREGTVSLADYRGKSPVLIGVFRGLYCPVCRRRIAQMGLTRDNYQAQGVETLGIVASKLEHARLYYRFHPARLPLAADPTMIAIRAFRVPKPRVTPQVLQEFQTTRIDPDNELPQPVPATEILVTLNERDGYEMKERDLDDLQKQWSWDAAAQLTGRYLIDRDGVVRWVDIECSKDGVAGLGKFTDEEELQAAMRAL